MLTFVRAWRERKNIAARLRKGQDLELQQCVTRLATTFIVGAYFVARAVPSEQALYSQLATALTIYFAYSLWHFAWVGVEPGNFVFRHEITIIGDQLATSSVFLLTGEQGFAVFVVFLWVSVGNGIRFGRWYMNFATAMALVGFTVAVIMRNLTERHLDVVIGIYVCLLALPIFVRQLFSELDEAHQRLKEQAAQLQHVATHDRLTGLPNRVVFFDRLNQVLSRAARQEVNCAVVYFDLDHFKAVNDSYGHAVGDELLRQVAFNVSGTIREGDSFCRLSGDEFVILAEGVSSSAAAGRIAEHVQVSVQSIKSISGNPIDVSASIGIALYPGSHANEDALGVVNRADLAMYISKNNGRGTYTFYRDSLAFNHSGNKAGDRYASA